MNLENILLRYVVIDDYTSQYSFGSLDAGLRRTGVEYNNQLEFEVYTNVICYKITVL